jgi:hypothetical protein
MARRIIGIGVALAAMGLATPVAAQSVDDDVRCLLASNFFAKTEKDPQKKQLAVSAAAFYLGRLDVRMSNDQLKNAALAQAKTLTGTSVSPLMNNCAKRVVLKDAALRGTGPKPGAPQPAAPQPAKPK